MKTDLLSEWEEVKLIDVSIGKGQYGSGASAVEFHSKKPRYVRITDINEYGKLKKNNLKSPNEVEEKYFLEKNDFLFARSGSVGRTYLHEKNNGNYQYAGYLIKFKLNTKLVSPKFLYYVTKSPFYWAWIEKQQRSVTIANINAQQYADFTFILPPLKIQEKIVLILEKAVKLKEMRKEADELTKNYLKSVFLEMFGNPMINSKKWEVKKMKDISKKIVNGTTPKGGKKVYVEKGIVFFRSQNVWKNRLSLDDVAYIDDDTHAKMKKSSLKNKDILMTKTGRINTENSSLGRASMFLGEDNSANINGHVYLIRLQENIIPEFVLFIITTNEYREYIRSVCVGGIDKRQINKEHLENFPIIFPPIELQKKFVSIVKEAEVMKELQKQSRIQIHYLFNHLMQKAFKGELVC